MAGLLVLVATTEEDADNAVQFLVHEGAPTVSQRGWGRGRVIVSGGVFEAEPAARVAAAARAAGWPADVRPEGGGHLDAWQAHTRPTVVSDRLWVCFPWSEFERDDAPTLVEIDPGRAFGTGAHPSTLLLLRQLDRRLRGSERVLDVGCGSGVLAVAAAALGAGAVRAIDIEPRAVEVTATNATRNQVTLSVDTTPISAVTGVFDVVLANIGWSTIIDMAPDLVARTAPGGWLAVSGISPAQVSRVAAALRPLPVTARPHDGEWAAVVCSAQQNGSGESPNGADHD